MHPTSEYPVVPSAPGAQPVQYAYQPYAVGPPAPPAVPPGDPRGRSAGFWIALSAAVTVVIIVALLGGFFIGRETRLSNAEVQSRLTEQQQVDKVAQEKAVSDQRTDMLRRQRALVSRVSSKAEGRGRREGRSTGLDEGFEDGRSQGFNQGQSQGRNEGYQDGRSEGFDQGVCTASSFFC